MPICFSCLNQDSLLLFFLINNICASYGHDHKILHFDIKHEIDSDPFHFFILKFYRLKPFTKELTLTKTCFHLEHPA